MIASGVRLRYTMATALELDRVLRGTTTETFGADFNNTREIVRQSLHVMGMRALAAVSAALETTGLEAQAYAAFIAASAVRLAHQRYATMTHAFVWKTGMADAHLSAMKRALTPFIETFVVPLNRRNVSSLMLFLPTMPGGKLAAGDVDDGTILASNLVDLASALRDIYESWDKTKEVLFAAPADATANTLTAKKPVKAEVVKKPKKPRVAEPEQQQVIDVVESPIAVDSSSESEEEEEERLPTPPDNPPVRPVRGAKRNFFARMRGSDYDIRTRANTKMGPFPKEEVPRQRAWLVRDDLAIVFGSLGSYMESLNNKPRNQTFDNWFGPAKEPESDSPRGLLLGAEAALERLRKVFKGNEALRRMADVRLMGRSRGASLFNVARVNYNLLSGIFNEAFDADAAVQSLRDGERVRFDAKKFVLDLIE